MATIGACGPPASSTNFNIAAFGLSPPPIKIKWPLGAGFSACSATAISIAPMGTRLRSLMVPPMAKSGAAVRPPRSQGGSGTSELEANAEPDLARVFDRGRCAETPSWTGPAIVRSVVGPPAAVDVERRVVVEHVEDLAGDRHLECAAELGVPRQAQVDEVPRRQLVG